MVSLVENLRDIDKANRRWTRWSIVFTCYFVIPSLSNTTYTMRLFSLRYRSVYCSICTHKDVCGEVTWIILFGKLTEISVSYKYRINIFWMHAHFPGPQNFDPCFDRLFYQHILSYPLGSSALEELCFS